MTRVISIFLLVVGVLWCILAGLYLSVALGGVTSAPRLLVMLLALSWVYIGPLLLIAGAVLSLLSVRQRLGAIFALVGSLTLLLMTILQWVQTVKEVHNPASIPPPNWELVAGALFVILTNVAAMKKLLLGK